MLTVARPTIINDDENSILSSFDFIDELSSHGNMNEIVDDKILIKRELSEHNLNNNFFEGVFKYSNSENGNNVDSKIPLSRLIDAIENSLIHSSQKYVIGQIGNAKAVNNVLVHK